MTSVPETGDYPTGRQVDLRCGDNHAVVTEIGAGLRELTRAGRPMIRAFAPDDLPPVYSGAVLAPWPNRLADGRYSINGRNLQVPINEVDRRNALHGLVFDRPWRISEESGSMVLLEHRLWPSAGYPFLLDLALRYTLDGDGLTLELRAQNNGTEPAPYGCSFHPYLVAGPGIVDDWTLHMVADRYLSVDPDRLLPQGLRSVTDVRAEFGADTDSGSQAVAGSGFGADSDSGFGAGSSLSGLTIDHAFTDLGFDRAGAAALQLRAADGLGVELRWDRSAPWLQICTGDRPEPALDRTGLAAEPMTCPPDAFNSGVDLVTLVPGQQHRMWIQIAALA